MRSGEKKILVLVLLTALTIRIAAIIVWRDRLNEDVDGYLRIAASIAAGDGYMESGRATAFRPPLYPLVLASVVRLGGAGLAIGCLQAVLGTLTVFVTTLICRRLELRLPWLPALIVAVDPLLIAYTARLMTEVLCGLMLSLLLYAFSRASASRKTEAYVCFGLTFGLVALCRPTIWASVPIVFAFGLLRFRKPWGFEPPEAMKAVLLAGLGASIVVSPWLIRNQLQTGAPILTTTHGGYTLLLGNNPQFYDVCRKPWGAVWDSLPWQAEIAAELRSDGVPVENERAVDRWMYARAFQNINADRSGFVRSCRVRFCRFWNIVPLVETTPKIVSVMVGGFYVLVLIGVLFAVCRRKRPAATGVLLFAGAMIITFAVVHVFYWSNTRMRAPLASSIAILSAYGWLGTQDRQKNGA